MNVRSIKLKFSLDVAVTIVLWANFMNEQTQNNRERSRFLKIFIQNPKVNLLEQFGKHYLDRGSVHASEIGWAHGKIQVKIHLKSGHIL